MKKLLVFLTGMMLFLQYGQSQQVARHFWLNPNSYNHTLSPTSDGGYILAAARQERGATLKNTIAVFKLDNAYNIQNTNVIGLLGGSPSGFDVDVDFEVHDVIENVGTGTNSYYVICGSISRGGPPIGMVAIVDAGLNTQSIREYPNAEVFYSVYADGNYFYVCGKTQNAMGIVMRDNIFPTAMPPTAYTTNQPWEYHKVKVNFNGNDLVVSGTDYNEVGFTAFNIANFATPAGLIASRRFPLYSNHIINSKVVVSNYPGNPWGTQGLVLSASGDDGFGNAMIHTYFFGTYLGIQRGFIMANVQSQMFLEDVEVDINSVLR